MTDAAVAVIDGASTTAAAGDAVAYACVVANSTDAPASGVALKISAVAILAASYFMAWIFLVWNIYNTVFYQNYYYFS